MRLWLVSERNSTYLKQIFTLSSCENIVLWRGHFNASGDEKSMNLSINGGEGEISEESISATFDAHLFCSLCSQCLAERCLLEHFVRKVCFNPDLIYKIDTETGASSEALRITITILKKPTTYSTFRRGWYCRDEIILSQSFR